MKYTQYGCIIIYNQQHITDFIINHLLAVGMFIKNVKENVAK